MVFRDSGESTLFDSGHNITCDNFFTLRKLGQELLKRKPTMVGTVRKNKPELPPQLLITKNRPVNSSKFVFTADTSVVSYVPKKGKNVVLMSTCGTHPIGMGESVARSIKNQKL